MRQKVLAALAALFFSAPLQADHRRNRDESFFYYTPQAVAAAITTLKNDADLVLRADIDCYEDESATDPCEDADFALAWLDAANSITFIGDNILTPAYSESEVGINNQAAMLFGVNDNFEASSTVLDYLGSQAWSIFIVMEHEDDTANNWIYDQLVSGSGIGYGLFMTGGKPRGFVCAGSSKCAETETTSADFADDTWGFLIVTYDGSRTAAGFNIYVSGTTPSDLTALSDLNDADNAPSQAPSIGIRTGAGSGWAGGSIAEIVIWPTALSTADRATLATYACDRYALGC